MENAIEGTKRDSTEEEKDSVTDELTVITVEDKLEDSTETEDVVEDSTGEITEMGDSTEETFRD